MVHVSQRLPVAAHRMNSRSKIRLIFPLCEGRFLQTHGPLLGRLDRIVCKELLRLYIGREDAPKWVLLDERCEKCMVFKPICGEFLWKRRIAGSIPVAGVKSLLSKAIKVFLLRKQSKSFRKGIFFVNFGHYMM